MANESTLCYVCPACKTAIEIVDVANEFRCSKCSSTWPVLNGVPHFIDSDSYWAEPGLTKEVLAAINKAMDHQKWDYLIKDHEIPLVRQQYAFISDTNRANWVKLLDLPYDITVLDLGSGMGTISQILSGHFKTIYAVEPVTERIDFSRKRFAQEGCNNINIVRADINNLPFPENSFDLIVLNGVLEWLPYSMKGLNPRKAQLHYLKMLSGLLKEGGYIYVGIENRLGAGLLAGGRDSHILLRYVAVLPRFLAHIVCKYKIGDIYRPYTYSYRGYKKLMNHAGFDDINIYSVLPSYNDPKFIKSMKQNSREFEGVILRSKGLPTRTIKKILSKLNILKYLGYSYGIICKKTGVESSLAMRLRCLLQGKPQKAAYGLRLFASLRKHYHG